MSTTIPARLRLSACLVALALGVMAGLSAPAGAQAPTTLNYQGRLLQNTADQDAVGGTVDIVFSIWSGPTSDGSAVMLWSETWNDVGLSNGIFSVLLGSNGSPLDPADFQGDSSLFLQLEIDGETLSPRQQLGSAPFAFADEPDNELQDLTLSGDDLSLTDSSEVIDLTPYLDNTDDQTLDLTGNTLTISGSGSSVSLSGFVDEDQDLSLTGNTLSLTDDPTPVDLSGYLDNTDEQNLSLTGNTLALTGDATPVDLSGYLDNTDNQDLTLSGNTLALTGDATSVNLSGYLDNTDAQTLNLSGTTLSISGSGSSVNLSGFTNTDNQNLGLSGNTLSITGGNSISLAKYLDNTDSQNLNNVLGQGNDAGDRNITNVNNLDADSFTCPDCIDTDHIDRDSIMGDDISDNIYILHIDCNGSCANMSMRDSCNVIENLRGLSTEVELIGVSCTHGIPSTAGNGFVACDSGDEVFGSYECRAFNLRTLGDLPCINDDGTDVIVTCLETEIAK